MKIQTRFGPGDFVDVDLREHGKLHNGELFRVIVGEFKVFYDITFKIEIKHGEDTHTTFVQLHDVDGDFVKPAAEKESLLPALGEIMKPS